MSMMSATVTVSKWCQPFLVWWRNPVFRSGITGGYVAVPGSWPWQAPSPISHPIPNNNNISNQNNTHTYQTHKLNEGWMKTVSTRSQTKHLISCSLNLLQNSWRCISGLPCLPRRFCLWRHYHQVKQTMCVCTKLDNRPLYQWPMDPDCWALCLRRLEHWWNTGGSWPKCKNLQSEQSNIITLWICQDWKVVLGEFDDSKDDGWEQTFDVIFIFFWH